MRKKVEVHRGWFGVVLDEGDQQSLVRLTKCDEPVLSGLELNYPNSCLREIKPTDKRYGGIPDKGLRLGSDRGRDLPPVDGLEDVIEFAGENPKREGSAAHMRWELLKAHHGKTKGDFLRASGNPTTLRNAINSGHVKIKESSKGTRKRSKSTEDQPTN